MRPGVIEVELEAFAESAAQRERQPMERCFAAVIQIASSCLQREERIAAGVAQIFRDIRFSG